MAKTEMVKPNKTAILEKVRARVGGCEWDGEEGKSCVCACPRMRARFISHPSPFI